MRHLHIHRPASLAEQAADWISGAVGSWRFVWGYIVATILWIGLNALPFGWDKYPFIFYTFSVSVLAILMSAIILLAANRQAQRDRRRDDLEALETEEILQLQHRQVELLEGLHTLQQEHHALLTELRRLA